MSGVEDWLLEHVPRHGNGVALDVGANEGAWTALLASRFPRVWAFEPNPQIVAELRRTVAHLRNVFLVECAVGNGRGPVDLNLYPETEHASSYTDAGLDTAARGGVVDTIRVPSVALDDLGFGRLQVAFLKVDVEGAEVDVLYGARASLAGSRPTAIVEVHNEPNIAVCQALLADVGLDVTHLPHPHPGVHAGHCWLIARPG